MAEYIKKEDVIEALTKQITDALRLVTGYYVRPQDVVERKRGEWDKDSDMAFYWKCSECGAYLFWRHEDFMVNGNPNYCPNCGSRMDLDGDTK